jgi:hypothetical protein
MILQKREKVGLVRWLYWSPDEVGKSRNKISILLLND